MMRKIMALAALCMFVLPVAAMDPAMEDAIRHGAMAKICYRVIDDDGCPVSNAVAHVWFSSYARHQDDADWLVTTDENGMFIVEHRTNESLDCGFDKEGYYHSSDQILFRDRKDVPVKVKDAEDDVFLALAKHVPALSSPVGGNAVLKNNEDHDLNSLASRMPPQMRWHTVFGGEEKLRGDA